MPFSSETKVHSRRILLFKRVVNKFLRFQGHFLRRMNREQKYMIDINFIHLHISSTIFWPFGVILSQIIFSIQLVVIVTPQSDFFKRRLVREKQENNEGCQAFSL